MRGIETDYLVIGAGAAGMAFADTLVTACDADVVMFANIEPAIAKLEAFTAEIPQADADRTARAGPHLGINVL